MLVLSRKKDECIVIGEGEDQVIITVNQIKGNKVSLMIKAGRHIRILRAELEPEEPRSDAA